VISNLLMGMNVKYLIERITGWARAAGPQLRTLGPYMAIELVLPGGSLIALGLWLYNHRGDLAMRCAARSAS
jgi:hypothetical protein